MHRESQNTCKEPVITPNGSWAAEKWPKWYLVKFEFVTAIFIAVTWTWWGDIPPHHEFGLSSSPTFQNFLRFWKQCNHTQRSKLKTCSSQNFFFYRFRSQFSISCVVCMEMSRVKRVGAVLVTPFHLQFAQFRLISSPIHDSKLRKTNIEKQYGEKLFWGDSLFLFTGR